MTDISSTSPAQYRPSALMVNLVVMMCAVAVFLGMFLPATTVASEQNTMIRYKIGDTMPPFEATSLMNKEKVSYTPGESNKPGLLLFFSLKPPFRMERSLLMIEILNKLNEKYAGSIDIFAFLCSSEDSFETRRLIQDGIIKVPTLDDTNREIYSLYGVFMSPLALLFNKEGNLHEIIPAATEVEYVLERNVRLLTGLITLEEFQKALEPPQRIIRTPEEREYIRRVNYGRVMSERKMYSAALREYLTASKILPAPVEAYIGLGNVFAYQGDWQKAEQRFKKALEFEPDSDAALTGLGIALHGQGKWEEAKPILENAVISEEPRLGAIVALAEIYEQQEEFVKASRLNKLAISLLLKRMD